MSFQRKMTRRFSKLGIRVFKDKNGRNFMATVRMMDNGKSGMVPLLDKNGREISQDAVKIVKGNVVLL